MIRAIVFDLDGVLVDAGQWHYEALNKALGLFGYHIGEKEHAAHYNGLPTRTKLDTLSRRCDFPLALRGFVNEMKQKYTRDVFAQRCKPNPALDKTLQDLKEQGYRLAVASNSSQATVAFALDGLGIRSRFDVVLSHEEVSCPKPSPEIYEETFRRLGVKADEALVLEDSAPGVQAAQASGAIVLTVATPQEVTVERVLAAIHHAERSEPSRTFPPIEIVVPMAGRGERFYSAGFDRPKPFISVLGKPMIEWVVENTRPREFPHRFTFLVHREHLRNSENARLLSRICPGSRTIAVPDTTQGAACTALLAAAQLPAQNPFVVVNSDQWVDFSMDEFLRSALQPGWDGSILTFQSTDPKWSYARTDALGQVLEVAEKQAISPHATVGIYFFRTTSLFIQAATELIRTEQRTRGEFYLCPVYNPLIRHGGKVGIQSIESGAMHGLGTPQDLEAFLRYQLSPRLPEHGPRPEPPGA